MKFSATPHDILKDMQIVSAPELEHELSSRDMQAFFAEHSGHINEIIQRGGGIYFKDFPIMSPKEFYKILKTINPKLIPYSGAKVRNAYADEEDMFLYAPTSTPKFIKNYLHNEMAYQPKIPSKIAFYCQLPASNGGGESIISDQRFVYKKIPADIRAKMESKQLLFKRHLIGKRWWHDFLSSHFDIFAIFPSWQNNFQTEDKTVVDEKCAKLGLTTQWHSNGNLTLSCLIDPAREHPITKEEIWVNNGHLFQLNKKVYGTFLYYCFKSFLSLFKLPVTVCLYGDGSSIEEKDINRIIESMEANEVSFPLKSGDFVYMNNLSMGHGRKVFRGKRKLYFALLE